MIEHMTDENYDAIVDAADKPILIDFHAKWCGPCRAMTPIVEKVAEERAGKLTVCDVDADTNPELTTRYNVVSIPLFVIIRDGKLVARSVGMMPKRELDEWIDAAIR